MEGTGGASGVRRGEVIAALSLATDLAMGQPVEFALKSCVLATRLALRAVELASAGSWGRMAASRGGEIVDVSLEEAIATRKGVPPEWIRFGRVVA